MGGSYEKVDEQRRGNTLPPFPGEFKISLFSSVVLVSFREDNSRGGLC